VALFALTILREFPENNFFYFFILFKKLFFSVFLFHFFFSKTIEDFLYIFNKFLSIPHKKNTSSNKPLLPVIPVTDTIN